MTTYADAQPSTVIEDVDQPSRGADLGTRTIRGIVQPDGTVYNGSGFSVTKNGTGNYQVTFDPPFSDIPAFSLTTGGVASSQYTNPLVVSSSSLTFTYRNAQGNAVDSWFFLIAMGGA